MIRRLPWGDYSDTEWNVFPAGGQEAERRCMGRSWCFFPGVLKVPGKKLVFLPTSLEGSHTNDCHGSTG